MTYSLVVSVTVKAATPLALVYRDGALITECPSPWSRVTVATGTGLPKWSFRVTVTVDMVVPSAATAVGLAATVDWTPSVVPAVKRDGRRGRPGSPRRCVSVTVRIIDSATVSRSWNSACPLVRSHPG